MMWPCLDTPERQVAAHESFRHMRSIGARAVLVGFDTEREHGPYRSLAYDGAPRDITLREAEAIAAREYDWRGCAMLSGGSDGGMHWRGDAYSPGAARGWAEEKRRGMVRRIMAGECRFTMFYDRHRDCFYCG